MLDGVLVLPIELAPTEAALFSGLSVIADIELVHFLPAERFRQLIESNQLHLSRLDGYTDDTREGKYPEINLDKSSNMDVQIERGFQMTPDRRSTYEQALITRKMTYVHCWFKGEPTSDYMWNKYGDAGKGVCIQGSSNRLRSSIAVRDSEFSCEVCECVYCDPEQPIPTGPSWFPALRKDKDRFDIEQEIRLLIRYKRKQGRRLNELPGFQKLPVNLNGLIGSIYFGPNMVESERQSISQAIGESGLIEKLKPLR